jgi:hypothetical protein
MAKNWAICVGINQYDNLPPLNCAVRDAEAMRDYFTEVDFDQVYLFTDNSLAITDEVFDSSTGFILPNGATRSPDVAWVEKSRWEALTPEQREKFLPLCPDFVIELVSPSDSIQKTRQKMEEYRENGCGLGWLINRPENQVEIYRPDCEVEVLNLPTTVLGENILVNLEINL